MARRTPLEEFVDRVGDDIADTLDGLAEGVLVGLAAALAGAGVARVAPAAGRKVKEILQTAPAPATGSRKPRKPARKAKIPKLPAKTPSSLPPAAPAELIDLRPGPDGVYE